MPNEDHLPDLRYARNWLDEIRTDLLSARDDGRQALVSGEYDASRDALLTFVRLTEKHAATLGDIIARGEVIPRDSRGARRRTGAGERADHDERLSRVEEELRALESRVEDLEPRQ